MAEPQSEDCLYLYVWAPHLDGKQRPVMVWVHGGALLNGSGSQSDNDGARFAEQGDLILMTSNDRLGVLGFLSLGEMARSSVGGGHRLPGAHPNDSASRAAGTTGRTGLDVPL